MPATHNACHAYCLPRTMPDTHIPHKKGPTTIFSLNRLLNVEPRLFVCFHELCAGYFSCLPRARNILPTLHRGGRKPSRPALHLHGRSGHTLRISALRATSHKQAETPCFLSECHHRECGKHCPHYPVSDSTRRRWRPVGHAWWRPTRPRCTLARPSRQGLTVCSQCTSTSVPANKCNFRLFLASLSTNTK
jgi:hypothetical protein